MAADRLRSLFALCRVAPVEAALLAGAPVVLAVGQLANGYLNGFSPAISLAFAVTMLAFGTVATDHRVAERRRRRLEG